MTPDLKTARAYVIPLGVEMDKTVSILTEFSHLVRKALSKNLIQNFFLSFHLYKIILLNMLKK